MATAAVHENGWRIAMEDQIDLGRAFQHSGKYRMNRLAFQGLTVGFQQSHQFL